MSNRARRGQRGPFPICPAPRLPVHKDGPRGKVGMENRNLRDPFWAVLQGRPAQHEDLIEASRRLAAVLIGAGKPISIASHGPWAGVWDLERLTDAESVAWGMWAARRIGGL